MKEREFVYRRLHSLLGIVPIGLFVVQHLLINHFSVYGEQSFNNAVGFMENLPFLLFLEIFVIYLPITYHAALGIYLALKSKNNINQYGYLRNWLFFFQRLTGILTLFFIVGHVWQTRIQVVLGNSEVSFSMMQNLLQDPLYLVLYIVGVISTVFHLANGLWSFCVSWGITQSTNSQNVLMYVTGFVFIGISYIGIRALFGFL